MHIIPITFNILSAKYLTKVNRETKSLFCGSVGTAGSLGWEGHGSQNLRRLHRLYPLSGRAEEESWCSDHVLHLIQYCSPPRWVLLPTFRVGRSTHPN